MGVKCPLFYIMEKFKHEEQFLKNLTEKTKEMFSIMGLTDGHNLSPSELKNRPKFTEYFSDSVQFSDGISNSESIYVYDENIYIYLSKSDPMISSFSCKIYYPIRKKKDVEFFILNLKKMKKNGN
jgi:hypothetical protein